MPIYSTNRVSSASTNIVAAEGYTEHDFGLILSECATNDMKLFNAAIARDFQEITAMQEGTMMSSEIRALQEFSIKEAWKGLVEKLKRLWAKIKGVFRNVYAKLSLWLNRSNKLYVAQNRRYLENKNLSDCPLPKYLKPKGNFYDTVSKTITSLENMCKKLKEETNTIDVSINARITNRKAGWASDLGVSDGDKTLNADTIYEALLDKHFEKADEKLTWSKCGRNLSGLFSDLSGSSKKLKDLKKMSKTVDKAFKTAIDAVNKAADKSDKEEKGKNTSLYKNTATLIGEFQNLMNATTSAYIKLTKKAINNDRGLIAALVAYDPKKATNENAIMCEFAYATGYYALHEETEDMTPEDIEDAAEDEGITVDINVSVDGDAEVGDVNVDGDDD